jgi:hypothetical protein
MSGNYQAETEAETDDGGDKAEATEAEVDKEDVEMETE